MDKCGLDYCDKPVGTAGLCPMHYQRKRKHGDVNYTKPPTHGLSDTPEYRIWAAMKHRCLSRVNPQYKDYGGRGITVCERWLKFENFIEDMGARPKTGKWEIDRINNNGNYEPSNCRWTTKAQSALNRNDLHLVEIDGETQPLSVWARKFNLKFNTLRYRVEQGWSGDKLTALPLVKLKGEK